MKNQPVTDFDRFILAVAIVLFLVGMGMALSSCSPKVYPQKRMELPASKPKFG